MVSPTIVEDRLPDGISFKMIFIEGGEFDMGGSDEEANDREKPVHRVKISPFYLGQYVVTQSFWKAIIGDNPSHFKGNSRPVEQVSWDDAEMFIGKLNRFTNRTYRLPTEAEWEYAARGGARMNEDGYLYAGSDKLKEVGWYDENSDNRTHEVGLKYPNELGLYDMSGNVFEWCSDFYDSDYYRECRDSGILADPSGPTKGADRVLRGGGWFINARYCRVAYRISYEPANRNNFIGFRLALALQSVD